MKWLMRYAGIIALVLAVISLEAMARDLDQDEVLRLRQDGVIQPLESLMQEALGVTPGRACWRSSWKRKTTSMSTRWNCSPATASCVNWNWMPATAAS